MQRRGNLSNGGNAGSANVNANYPSNTNWNYAPRYLAQTAKPETAAALYGETRRK